MEGSVRATELQEEAETSHKKVAMEQEYVSGFAFDQLSSFIREIQDYTGL